MKKLTTIFLCVLMLTALPGYGSDGGAPVGFTDEMIEQMTESYLNMDIDAMIEMTREAGSPIDEETIKMMRDMQRAARDGTLADYFRGLGTPMASEPAANSVVTAPTASAPGISVPVQTGGTVQFSGALPSPGRTPSPGGPATPSGGPNGPGNNPKAPRRETPYDRFSRMTEWNVHINIVYEYTHEYSSHIVHDGSYPTFITGTEGRSSRSKGYFESEWSGVIRHPESWSSYYDPEYHGALKADVSGEETLEEISDCDVQLYIGIPDMASTAESHTYEYRVETVNDQYNTGGGGSYTHLSISPEGNYILKPPGGYLSMPGRYRYTVTNQGHATGLFGEDYPNYTGDNFSDGNEGDTDVSFHGTVSWEIENPLPEEGLTLTGEEVFTEESSNPGASHYSIYTITYTITPYEPPPLKAVITANSPVKRGDTVHLSGSESTGDITEYKWTFKASNPGGSQPNNDATIISRQADVTLLANTSVTLTVTDGRDTDSETKTMVVQANDFKTEFRHVDEEGELEPGVGSPPRLAFVNGEFKKLRGGLNVCAICLNKDSEGNEVNNHWLHPDPNSAAQEEMYTLKQVNDMGPWNGFYYLSDWKMKLHRKMLLNKYILEEGPVSLSGMKINFYKYNEEKGIKVKDYLAKVKEHEKMHSKLAEEALKVHDPAKECEKTFDSDEGGLKERMKAIIVASEQAIDGKSDDPLEKKWEGELYVVEEDTGRWHKITTQVGEDVGKWWP